MSDPSTTGTLSWRRSSYSQEGNCLELARLPNGDIAVRNSNHPTAGTMVVTDRMIRALLQGAKAGEFDDMI